MYTLRHLRVPAAALAFSTALVGGAAAAAPAHASPDSAARQHVAHTVAPTRQVRCTGTAAACTATVGMAHGASNQRVDIHLPASGMRLESVRPTSRTLDGGYLVSDQAMRNGGRDYMFTLNAVEAPAGSALKFQFRKPTQSSPMIVRCHGGSVCQAIVPIAGGASNRRVVVQLPRTDLGLVSVKPSSANLRGAYSLSRQKLRPGASEYTFVLNAVQGAPRGSHLTLTFRRQPVVTSPRLGDDPGGCTQIVPTNDNSAGWSCPYNSNNATFTVPPGEGISGIAVSLAGGQGGNSNPASGGYGGMVQGVIPVSGGQTLTINPGGQALDEDPGTNPEAAADGGGAGCSAAGAGGAASTLEVDGTTVAVAGGGGGGGAQGIMPGIDDGGAGGTPASNNGNGSGGKGPGSGDHGKGGDGGTSLSPGGHGSHGKDGGGCSGGGGGGWSGGGAGGRGAFGGGGGAGGGAGGSYIVSTATNTSFSTANAGGDGNVTFTWVH